MNPGSIIRDPNPYEDPDLHWDPELWRIRINDEKDPDHHSGSQNGKKIRIPGVVFGIPPAPINRQTGISNHLNTAAAANALPFLYPGERQAGRFPCILPSIKPAELLQLPTSSICFSIPLSADDFDSWDKFMCLKWYMCNVPKMFKSCPFVYPCRTQTVSKTATQCGMHRQEAWVSWSGAIMFIGR